MGEQEILMRESSESSKRNPMSNSPVITKTTTVITKTTTHINTAGRADICVEGGGMFELTLEACQGLYHQLGWAIRAMDASAGLDEANTKKAGRMRRGHCFPVGQADDGYLPLG